MIRAALACFGLALATPANAQDSLRCAALWAGYGDVARTSPYLDGADQARAEAARFRALALRNGASKTETDAAIAAERPGMALLIEALLRGDAQSRALFDRQMTLCAGLNIDKD
ncbi:hypothetical protein [Puniceibacterium sp. IMCC21224]|uniref:hypothetical protein n=1 Tax=Puniceibacterium sp. IMCC21224 TaxID=1618204 RepID=UPI00064DD6DC|nr:hypothetical protein [Puniceibacterium sp. IMCC21224]KMK67873.1 hypothetical protein IMCC21224_112750 [Puniceibacterium sp. IMCC21224]